ncbi:hypothetical protein [Staphylococcus phage vB_StaM_SA1]|nr:hypothetical protein [Staphylococcus phage vB_StaM_SA1]
MDYLENGKGEVFPVNEEGMENILFFLLDYSHKNKYNTMNIVKEVNDNIMKNENISKKFINKNTNEVILKLGKVKGDLVNELAKNGYIVNFSRNKISVSIYVKNDDMKLVRISDHNINKKVKKKGIISNRFDYQVKADNRLVSDKDLREVGINISEGIYYL